MARAVIIMKTTSNERLINYPTGNTMVGMVRAAYAGMPYIITVSIGRGFNYRFRPNWKIVLITI